MTDRIFYEELRATIRDAIASYLDTYTDEELRELATESLNLPPRPTLPDGWRLADHPDYGRVVVTTENQDRDGYVYFTFPDDDVLGYEWHFCRPSDLTYIDTGQEADQ